MDNKKQESQLTFRIFAPFVIASLPFGIVVFDIAKNIKNGAGYKLYKNVIVEKKNDGLLIEDVNTKEQRIVSVKNLNDVKYMFSGDTIIIKDKNDYQYDRVLPMSSVLCNKDSIYARKQREIFNSRKQEMMNQR